MVMSMDKRTDKEILERLQQADAERQREWEEVRRKYPINPNDPPEKQEEMRIAQNVAMLDP